jgi:hypothetical protein
VEKKWLSEKRLEKEKVINRGLVGKKEGKKRRLR